MPRPIIFNFIPDSTSKCYICDSSPCVKIPEHPVPDTKLCGPCFFQDRLMIDPDLWNDQPEDTE